MLYQKITLSSDPKIIGVTNGIFQVELKPSESFSNAQDESDYKNFFNGNVDRFLTENFEKFKDISPITFFPLKKAKQTDFISCSPYEVGLDFLISERVLSIFSNFSLGDHIIIKSRIINFKYEYYYLGFPMETQDIIIFSKSKFVQRCFDGIKNTFYDKDIEIKNQSEYQNLYDIHIKKLYIKPKKEFTNDIISIQGVGIFFSLSLIEEITKKNITGLDFEDSFLEVIHT